MSINGDKRKEEKSRNENKMIAKEHSLVVSILSDPSFVKAHTTLVNSLMELKNNIVCQMQVIFKKIYLIIVCMYVCIYISKIAYIYTTHIKLIIIIYNHDG